MELKRKCFKLLLKLPISNSVLSSAGNEFHTAGASLENARHPKLLVLTGGGINEEEMMNAEKTAFHPVRFVHTTNFRELIS